MTTLQNRSSAKKRRKTVKMGPTRSKKAPKDTKPKKETIHVPQHPKNPFQTQKNLSRFHDSMLTIGISLGNYILSRKESLRDIQEPSAASLPAHLITRCITCIAFHFLFSDVERHSLIYHDASLQKTLRDLLHALDSDELEGYVRRVQGELKFDYYKAMWHICVLGLKLNESGGGNAAAKSDSSTSSALSNLTTLKSLTELISSPIILLSTQLPSHANSFELEYLDMDEITDYELRDVQELDNDEEYAIPVRITLPETESNIRTFLLPLPLSLQFALLLRLKVALSIKLYDAKMSASSQANHLPASSLPNSATPQIGSSLNDLISLSESITREYGFQAHILWYKAFVHERNQLYAQAYKSYVLCAEEALEGSLMRPIALYRAAAVCGHFTTNQEANDALELENGEIAVKQRLLCKSLEEKAQNLVLQGIRFEDDCYTNDLEELNALISVRESATKEWFPQNYNFHLLRQDDGENKSKSSEDDPSAEPGQKSARDDASGASPKKHSALFRPPNLQKILNLNMPAPQKELIIDDDSSANISLWTAGLRFVRESVEWYQWVLFLMLMFIFVLYLHFVAWRGGGLSFSSRNQGGSDL